MKWKDAIRKYEWVAIPLVLVVVSFLGGSRYGQKKVLASIESKSDTIVRVVPVYKDFPQPQKTAILGYLSVPKYKFLTDTINTVESLVLHDTTVVYLPREQKYYSEADGALRLWVSGYEPRLDRYEVDYKTVYVTQTLTKKPPRWGLGISAGFGATISKERVVSLAPYIGIGLQYNLVSW